MQSDAQLAAPVLAAPLLEQRRPSDGGSTSALDGDARQPSVARRWSNRRHRKLGVVSVAMIVFFNVSGGPIGSEQVVTYGGPFVGLGAMALFACVFSVPQAMMTAELSTAMPDNGGYSLWVQAAFGDFWGVQESYWSWFSGVVDSALYPVLLYSSAMQLLSGAGAGAAHEGTCAAANATLPASLLAHGGALAAGPPPPPPPLWSCSCKTLWLCLPRGGCALELSMKLGVLFAFTAPNLLSSKAVGLSVSALGVFVMAPFVVMVALAIPRLDPSLLLLAPKKYDVGKLASLVYWNLSGFDSASTFAGEVDAPHDTYPRALTLSVMIALASYLLPLLAASMVDPSWPCWREGSLAAVAQLLGGPWLGGWLLLAVALGNWGLYASELLEDSYQLLGMAEVGMAPRVFAKRHARLGTPINAILIQLVAISLLVGLNFDAILAVDNFFSAAAAALEFAALVQLRRTQPDLARPFRVPLGTRGLAAFSVLPFCSALWVMYVTATDSVASMGVCAGGTAIGLLLYLPFKRSAVERVLSRESAPGDEGG